MKIYKLNILLAGVLFLQACSPATNRDDSFSSYESRISNVLDTDTKAAPVKHIIQLPTKRSLTREIPRVSMGLLESYSYRKCGLFQLIAEKNSSLGKVQDQFANLDYQMALLARIESCLSYGELNQNEIKQLTELKVVKSSHYPDHWHNLITASDEIRTQISRSQWLTEEMLSHSSELEVALNALASAKETTKSLPVVSYQEKIDKIQLVGPLLFSLYRSTQWLEQITAHLNRYQNRIVCKPNRDKQTFTYLANVFSSTYISKIQPYISELDKLYYDISPALAVILTPYKNSPLLNYKQLHKNFRQAVQNHSRFWTMTFKRCGMNLAKR